LTVDRADCRVEFEQVGVLLLHREERYEPSSWVKLPLPWMTFKAERSCRHEPRSPSARPATEVVQPEERLCVSADRSVPPVKYGLDLRRDAQRRCEKSERCGLDIHGEQVASVSIYVCRRKYIYKFQSMVKVKMRKR